MPERTVRVTGSQTAALAYVAAFAAASLWHQRATGSLPVAVIAFFAVGIALCAVFGMAFRRWTHAYVPLAGAASELLVGFFVVSSLLFALALATPLGAVARALVVCVAALALLPSVLSRGRREERSVHVERASLVCIVVCAAAATLWTRDMQPIAEAHGADIVYRAWSDTFIHVREISAFAASHGVATVSDIRAAGVRAPVYHVAGYMVPATLTAVTGATALSAFSAFQLPFGILLTGLAALTLANALFGVRAALFAAVVVVMCPDPFQQGVGIKLLAYHFMSQVNIGTLYGIACICVGWLFMIEGCRRERLAGVAIAFAVLAVCLTYKAHIFVANALPMLIYPCIFFRRVRAPWRIVAGIAFVALFVAVIAVSQRFDRVPVMRLDGSGLLGYVYELIGATDEGARRDAFNRFLVVENHGLLRSGLVAAAMIASATFGAWLFVWPVVTWVQRRRWDVPVIVFPMIVVANYFVMALGLALDTRGVGEPEELLNRPFAWAYFVVVVWSAAGIRQWLAASPHVRPRVANAALAAVVIVLLGTTFVLSRNLQTVAAWGGHATYADMNTVPACEVRAAEFIRAHAGVDDVVQDEAGDPRFALTALSERADYVAEGAFGGPSPDRDARLAEVRALGRSDEGAIEDYLRAHRVDWYLMHPDPGARRAPAAFACDGFALVHVAR